MKRFTHLIAAALILNSLMACGLDNVYHEESKEIVVDPPETPDGLTEVASLDEFEDLDLVSGDSIGNIGIDREMVDYVKITLLELEVQEDDDRANLDFLEEIVVYLEADGLDRIKVASASDIADGLKVLELDLEDVDVADYLVAEDVEMVTEAQGSKPSVRTTINTTVGLDIDINLKAFL